MKKLLLVVAVLVSTLTLVPSGGAGHEPPHHTG